MTLHCNERLRQPRFAELADEVAGAGAGAREPPDALPVGAAVQPTSASGEVDDK